MRRILQVLVAVALMAPAAAAEHQPRPAASFVARPRLGLVVLHITPELRGFFGAPDDRGILVARVEPGTPADRAGIRVGDVVTEIDGHAIADAADVGSALAARQPGDAVTIAVIRDHHARTLTAALDRGGRQAVLDLFHMS